MVCLHPAFFGVGESVGEALLSSALLLVDTTLVCYRSEGYRGEHGRRTVVAREWALSKGKKGRGEGEPVVGQPTRSRLVRFLPCDRAVGYHGAEALSMQVWSKYRALYCRLVCTIADDHAKSRVL